jgi:6-phosphofructokinase 2
MPLTPPRIVTWTLNPAVDFVSTAPVIAATHKIRTHDEHVDPGGGGVNVARVVHALGGETLAIFAAGDVTGRFLDELLQEAGVPRHRVPVAGRTRVSFTFREETSGREYRFVPEGPTLSDAEWHAALAALPAASEHYVVASGSLPRAVPVGIYAEAARLAAARGQAFVLDTSGEALRAALGHGITLLKPSLRELETLVGRTLPDPAAQEKEALVLVRNGAARMVVVTLGDAGAILASEAGVLRRQGEPRRQHGCTVFEAVVGLPVELAERRQPGRRRKRVPRERPCLVDGPDGGEHLHHVAPPPERADRQPAPEDLSEAEQVQANPEALGRPARSEAEAGDHLVEDQQRANVVTRRAQCLEEPGLGRHDTHVRRNRLDDDARHALVEHRDHVVRSDHGLGDGLRGDACGVRQTERGEAATSPGKEEVSVAVVAPGELHDAAPPGEPPCDTDRAHRRLGARGGEAQQLDGGDPATHLLGEHHLSEGRRPEAGPIRRSRRDRFEDGRVPVTEDRGAVGLDVVEIATALDIDDVRTLAPRHEVGRAADGAERANRRAHPPREAVERAREQCLVRQLPRTRHRSPRRAGPWTDRHTGSRSYGPWTSRLAGRTGDAGGVGRAVARAPAGLRHSSPPAPPQRR